MGYVAVKGGTIAIEASSEALKYERLKKGRGPSVTDIYSGMRGLIDQVMSEASLYSEELAAVAIKQAEGSMEEAVFLLRAYRSTLQRKHTSMPIEYQQMAVCRRISASFKDIPGGQLLGASHDYTHRLLDFDLLNESESEVAHWLESYRLSYLKTDGEQMDYETNDSVVQWLKREGLISPEPLNDMQPKDVTKKNLEFPSSRSERLQILTRAQTGALTALGYAAIRGYGMLHPTVGELRVGVYPVAIPSPFAQEQGDDEGYYIGDIQGTEVEMLIPISVKKQNGQHEIDIEVGYGFCFGQNETKAIAMSIIENGLESAEKMYPTQDEEFVLMHVDSVEATGFISHLKLPHYVTFQSKLDSVRKHRKGEGQCS